MAESAEVTALLRAWAAGQPGAADHLVPVIYQQLRRRAAAYLRGERRGHTLQPTALVHEAYLRLVDQQQVIWQNRAQFFGLASQMMRRILVDHARRRNMHEALGAVATGVSRRSRAGGPDGATSTCSRSTSCSSGWRRSMRARAASSSCGTSADCRSRKPPACSTSRRGRSSGNGARRAPGCTAS